MQNCIALPRHFRSLAKSPRVNMVNILVLAVSTHPHKLVEWEYHGLSVTCLMAGLAGHMCSKYKH